MLCTGQNINYISLYDTDGKELFGKKKFVIVLRFTQKESVSEKREKEDLGSEKEGRESERERE